MILADCRRTIDDARDDYLINEVFDNLPCLDNMISL